MGSLKTVLMNLFAGWQWRCRHKTQGYKGGHRGCRRKERAELAARVMWTYTLPYVKQPASGCLLYDSGNSNQGSVTKERGRKGWRWKGGLRGRGHMGTFHPFILMYSRNQYNTESN